MLDLEHCRKDAKALVRAFRAGETAAVARAEAILGERTRQRFRLSDAQHVVAVERGFRTWPELRRAADARREALVDSGLEYRPGEPVLVRIVRRWRRVLLSDDGRGVALAGRPPGWRDAVERTVERELGLNLGRHGEVFVPVVTAGPGLEPLVQRVAEASRAAHQEILDLEG